MKRSQIILCLLMISLPMHILAGCYHIPELSSGFGASQGEARRERHSANKWTQRRGPGIRSNPCWGVPGKRETLLEGRARTRKRNSLGQTSIRNSGGPSNRQSCPKDGTGCKLPYWTATQRSLITQVSGSETEVQVDSGPFFSAEWLGEA